MRKVIFLANLAVVSASVLGMNFSGMGAESEDSFGSKRGNFAEGVQWGQLNKKVKVSSRRDATDCGGSAREEQSSNRKEDSGCGSATAEEALSLSGSEISHAATVVEDYSQILEPGEGFLSLTKLTLCSSTLKNLPLESLALPKLTKLTIYDAECTSLIKLNELISKVSSTLLELEISVKDNDLEKKEKWSLLSPQQDNQPTEELGPDLLKQTEGGLSLGNQDLEVRTSSRISEPSANRDPKPENLSETDESSDPSGKQDKTVGIPEAVWRCKKLNSLNLEGFCVGTVPPEIGNLTNLENLRLFGSDLTALSAEIGNLTNLEELDLGFNRLTTLPPEIGKLAGLDRLSLTSNELKSLPAEIGNLTNLEELDLTGNNFASLPSEIGKLINLEILTLDECHNLTELPSEISNLINLGKLCLNFTKIRSFPSEMWNLLNLKHVELEYNSSIRRFMDFDEYDLESYNEDEYAVLANEVEKLDLSNERLIQLPLDIIMCENLVELDISNNELTEVPALLGKLEHLQEINVSGNRKIDSIEKIPDAIFGLPELEAIILSENGKCKKFNKIEIAKTREERIKKIGDELKKIRDNNRNTVAKYQPLHEKKVTKEYLKEGVKQDREAFAKEYFLKNLITKLSFARDKRDSMSSSNDEG